MQRLHFPARPYEFSREPLEQFRMGWRLAAHTEVVYGSHQSLPEMVLPHSIYQNTRRKAPRTVIQVRDPFGQRPSLLRGIIANAFGLCFTVIGFRAFALRKH